MTDHQRRDDSVTELPAAMTVAIYARGGVGPQSERSIEDQVDRCRAHAEREGWSVAEVFTDVAT